MSKPLRVGVVLPTRGLLLSSESPDWSQLISLAARAEEIGVDSLWVGDSLIAKPRLEPLSVLAAIAGATSRVGLGTSVLLAPLRNPVLLAQTAATVDLLSNGRLTLGMGVGGTFTEEQKREWRAAGVDPVDRGGRLAEMVELMQLLWTGEPVSYAGRHFNIEATSLGLRPKQTPGVRTLLACHAGIGRHRQYGRAGKLADGMISITDSPEEFRAVREAVLDELAKAGRPLAAFHSTYYMTVNLNPDPSVAWAEGDAFVRAYYGLNYWQERWGPYGRPPEVIERALQYAKAGADEIIFRFAAPDQRAQLESFAREVLPALRTATL